MSELARRGLRAPVVGVEDDLPVFAVSDDAPAITPEAVRTALDES